MNLLREGRWTMSEILYAQRKLVVRPILILVITLSVLVGTQKGLTAGTDIQDLAPYRNLFSNSQIRQLFVNLNVTPFGREDLALSLLVPKNWRDIPLKVDPKLLQSAEQAFVPLTLQLAPEGKKGHPLIEVRYNKLDLEVGLSDWVDYYLQASEYEALLRRSGKYNRREVQDVLVDMVQDGTSYIVRLTFSKHGDRIFVVSCSAAKAVFEEYAKIFGAAVVSFTVKEKSETEYAEPMRDYRNEAWPPLRFKYPSSWIIKEAEELPEGKTGIDISLRAADREIALAFIHVKGISNSLGESLKTIMNKMRKDFKSSGVNFVGKADTKELRERITAPFIQGELWDVTVGGVPSRLALIIQSFEGYYTALGLLTVREGNPFASMTGWRVFEIVASDLAESSTLK